MKIDQMTKTIEAHKSGLGSGNVENRKGSIRIIRFLSAKWEKRLKKKLLLQNDAEQKEKSTLSSKSKVEELIEKRNEIAK